MQDNNNQIQVTRRVDSRGQEYLLSPNGIKRLNSNGVPVERLRLSKKERRKLRAEYNNIKDFDQKTLADNILNTPVINPALNNIKSESILGAKND